MKVTNLQDAVYLDWLYLHSPVGHLLEDHFDIKYCSGDDGTFMEINAKGYNEDTTMKELQSQSQSTGTSADDSATRTIRPVPQWQPNEK